MIAATMAGTVLLIIILGAISARQVNGNNSNFAVAGRSMSVPIVAILLMSQVIDSNATVGAADLASEFGFWGGAAMPLGLAASFLILGLFVANKIRNLELYSLPQYFRMRFGRTGELLAAVLTVAAFGILMAGNLVALGHMMDQFLGVPYWAAIVFVTLAIMGYTMLGGMFASAYTGVFLLIVMATGFSGLTLWMLFGPGYTAPDGLGILDFGQLTESGSGAVINWATFFALALGNLVAIDLFQRISSAKSPAGARSASLWASIGTVVLVVPLAAVAVAAPAIIGDSDSGSSVLFQLLVDHVPGPVVILVIAALLAASLTTVSGVLLATSSIIVTTLSQSRRIRIPLLRATRLSMIPVALIGIVVALRVTHTGILLTLTFDLLCASVVFPFLLSLTTKLVSTRALVVSAVLGLGTRLVFFVLTPTIYGLENTLLYIPNDLVTEAADGWTTFLAAGVSLVVYVLLASADVNQAAADGPDAPQHDDEATRRHTDFETCERGHELRDGNLRIGKKICRACHVAETAAIRSRWDDETRDADADRRAAIYLQETGV